MGSTLSIKVREESDARYFDSLRLTVDDKKSIPLLRLNEVAAKFYYQWFSVWHEDKHVGCFMFSRPSDRFRHLCKTEVSILVFEEFRGKGIAKDILVYLSRHQDADQYLFQVKQTNNASLHLFRKFAGIHELDGNVNGYYQFKFSQIATTSTDSDQEEL